MSQPRNLRQRDISRALDEIWPDDELADRTDALLDEGVRRDRKSLDRVLIHSYLGQFPTEHASFNRLAAASRLVAERHDWPWRERGDTFQLWEPTQGPVKLARALISADDAGTALRRAGLDGDLATGAFVRQAAFAACFVAATHKGQSAIDSGSRLMMLSKELKGAEGLDGPLAFALLAPWVQNAPPAEHQRRVGAMLVARVGDPRLSPARWAALRTQLRGRLSDADIDAAFGVLRRWLVQATVREFFAVVEKTTDRKDQWKERTEFWLGYLDAGYITDAWFAFGHMAEREARRFLKDDSIGFARIEGRGADASHSSLLMTLGDLRIAEWSHNGSCRFWPVTQPKAPAMYRPKYVGTALRTMLADRGYEPLSHHSGWQHKFAKRVAGHTGIKHPRYGGGW